MPLDLNGLAAAYGRSAFEKAQLNDGQLNSRQLGMLRRALNKDVRHFHDLAMPDLLQPKTSSAAIAAARLLPESVDLCRQTWFTQPSFDAGRRFGVFHLEHKITVSSMVDAILTAVDPSQVVDVLLQSELVWITKDEDVALRRQPNNRDRGDTDALYTSAGIELVDCPH